MSHKQVVKPEGKSEADSPTSRGRALRSYTAKHTGCPSREEVQLLLQSICHSYTELVPFLPHPTFPSPLLSLQCAKPRHSVIQNTQYNKGYRHLGIVALLIFIAMILYFFIVLRLRSLAWKAAFEFKLYYLKSCQ